MFIPSIRRHGAHMGPFIKPEAIICFILVLSSCDNRPAIPGPRTAYTPVATYPKVKKVAGPGAELYELAAKKVKPDGTLDFNGSSPKEQTQLSL